MTLASYRPERAQEPASVPSLLDILGVGDFLGDRTGGDKTKPDPNAPGMLLSYPMAKQAMQPILVVPDYDDAPEDPDVSIKIEDVQMAGPSTLRVTLSGDSGGQPVPVHIQSQINGTNVDFDAGTYDLGTRPSVDIDLKAKGVKRFRDNATFTINATATSGEKSASDAAKTTVLLPVVLVEGIAPGPGTGLNGSELGSGVYTPRSEPGFDKTIAFLKTLEGPSTHTIRFTTDNGMGFANVFPFSYARNQSPFDAAAGLLDAKWMIEWSAKCYADRFNVVSHSQGTLIVRALLSNPSHRSYNSVKTALLVQGPHTGSGFALGGGAAGYDYRQLFPLWPWHSLGNGKYEVPSEYGNPTLAALNRRAHNLSTTYVLCTSAISNGAVAAAGSRDALVASAAQAFGLPSSIANAGNFVEGDGVVPTFSQLGEMYDPATKQPSIVPAFARLRGASKLLYEAMGKFTHGSFEDSPAYRSALKKYLLGP